MYYQQEELPPPSNLQRLGSVDTLEDGFSIETYDKALTHVSDMQFEEEMMVDEESYDDQDDILEYHYPLVEEPDEGPDDDSLAARDSLALQPKEEGGDIPQEILRHPAPEDRYRRGRRSLWLLICLLTVALIITLSIAIPQSRKSADEEEDNNREAFLENGEPEVDVPEPPSPSPSAAPTHPHETSLAFMTLKPKVEDPDLLLDPSTPQGKAFEKILNEDSSDPFLITQRYALLALFYGTDGDNWDLNVGWVDQQPDECLGQWVGVNGCRMQDDGVTRAVSAIELESNGLAGALPVEVCLLENLEHLVVAGNGLTGELPACLTSMKKLEEINIVNNKFSGPLPSGLLLMPSIEHLVFSNNELSGSLDALFDSAGESDFMSAFTTLKTLALDNNMFTGQPPNKLFFVRNLVTLTLHNNMLTGSLEGICDDDEAQETAGLPGRSINTLTADCTQDVVVCTCCTECY